jgi:hypothetical protein
MMLHSPVERKRSVDWLTFYAKIAELLAGMAWPAVVVTVLVCYRDNALNLIERLRELTLPGGAKAVFDQALAKANLRAEEVPLTINVGQAQEHAGVGVDAPSETPPTFSLPTDYNEEMKSNVDLAKNFPEAAVMNAFLDIETHLVEIRDQFFPWIKGTRPVVTLIEQLRAQNLIDDAGFELFTSLRQARNSVVHGKTPVTPLEAVNYQMSANAMRRLLNRILIVLTTSQKLRAQEPA